MEYFVQIKEKLGPNKAKRSNSVLSLEDHNADYPLLNPYCQKIKYLIVL